MQDLIQLLQEIDELPTKIYSASLDAAEKENIYETMKEENKSKRAAIINCYSDFPMSKAESIALASEQYRNLIAALSVARFEHLKAQAYSNFLSKRYDAVKSMQIAHLSQMKLI